MELKMRINKAISTSQSLGIFDISDESKVRIIVQEAGASNTLIIRGRLKEQPNFIELYTITGSVNQVINVFTYEEIQIECTVCEPLTDQIKIYAASFSEAGGSAIDSIDVPSGDPITDFTSLSLESQDGSIKIEGDNTLKSIDFSTESSLIPYTQNTPTDWEGITNTIADASDELASRTRILETNKIDIAQKGSPDGVAPLNSLSKIDSIYLPSYVDDVEEYSSLTTFPLIGESSKIYVALDTNKAYRWSGSLYIEISEALVTSVNGDVGDVVIPIDDKVNKIGDIMTGDLVVTDESGNINTVSADGISISGGDLTAEYTKLGYFTKIQPTGTTYQKTSNGSTGSLTIREYDSSTGLEKSVDIRLTGIEMLETLNVPGNPLVPIMPTSWGHLTVKKYVDDQDMQKENVVNKSTDSSLLPNSDGLYPSQKAVKTYVDNLVSNLQSSLDATTYYHELHVNFDYLGITSDGSPYKPFKTIQEAVNAAQLQNVGGNTAILIHLKKDITITENVVVNNAVSNLYISPAVSNNIDSSPLKIIGSLTISGVSTNRVRVKDLHFVPTSGYALVVNDSNGRHMFQNCQFSNGGIPALAGTGVNLTSTYKNFIEFVDCTVEGTFNIDGSPNPGTLVSLYRCRLASANVIVNSSNLSVAMYDTYGLYSLNHTAGALAITGLWGIVSSFNSTANVSATNFISLSNVSLQKYDLSFAPLNKTGTCFYQLLNVHRGETSDVLNGTRAAYGPTATDAGYKMGVSANWSPAVLSVAPALDQLVQRVKNSETSSTNTAAILEDTKEPTGFINRTDSTISFVDGSRLFTISPVSTSFSFYIKGQKFTKSVAQQLTIPNQAGNHYIYFNTSGNLESTQIFTSDIIEKYAFVSVIYWNTDTNSHTYFAEERHGITMDGATHSYLHTTFGSRYLSGLALQNFTVDGNGSLEAHAQFTADEGSIRDEDILLTSLAQSQIPILYRQGQLWRKKTADAFPVIYSGTAGYTGANGRLPFNEYIAGTWQLTQASTSNYILVHLFATNDKENPIVGIQGIAEYINEPQAKAAASSEITSLTGLPFAEFVAIGTVLFQTNSYTNTPNARIVGINGGNYVDFRGTQLYIPAGTATTHSLLSGLSNDDHVQYHNDSRGDARYYTKSQIDSTVVYKNGTTPFAANQSMAGFKLTNLANPTSLTDAVNLQTLNAAFGSSGDITEKSFAINDNQPTPILITDFIFPNLTCRSFTALVSVRIQASSNLSETFEIRGIQKDSDWFISITSEGDSSKVTFTINSSGQMYYTSGAYAGFVDGVVKFRAITTSV